jgi:predicted phosphodiesterase
MPPSSLSENNLFLPTEPTTFQLFYVSPLSFLLSYLYTHQPTISAPLPHPNNITVVCISDTHNMRPRPRNGDILIHAGDLTINGSVKEVQEQVEWLNILPHRYKIVVGGNHDMHLDSSYDNKAKVDVRVEWGHATYPENTSTTIHLRGRTLKIFGAPHTPQYGNWAFQYAPMQDVWTGIIPSDADVVVTHGLVKGHVDASFPAAGCAYLLREVVRVKPILHVCGHVHKARGVEAADWNSVQWGYDRFQLGEEGIGVAIATLGAWIWTWMSWVVGGERKRQMVFVNAAVRDHESAVAGEEEEEEGIVVEV